MFESCRLRLRVWKRSDLRFLDPILGALEVMQFGERSVLALADQETWLRNAVEHAAKGELPGVLSIEEEAAGQVRSVESVVASIDPNKHRSLRVVEEIRLVYDSNFMVGGCTWSDRFFPLKLWSLAAWREKPGPNRKAGEKRL